MQERLELPRISFNDFVCPITSMVFFEPAQTIPCSHLFEKKAIDKWLKTADTCPCCRKRIENLCSPPTVFNNQLMELLKKNPQLQDERYFDLADFYEVLEHGNQNDKLKKMLHLLKSSSKHLNAISEEKNFEGTSAVFFLANSSKGREILINDTELRSHITSDALNSIDQRDGGSAVYGLMSGLPTFEILKNDSTLRSKITPTGLNAILKASENRGLSAVFWLLKWEGGVELLKNDPVLRSKITVQGLDVIKEDGDSPGDSAVSFLVGMDNGVELLKNDPTLRAKITARGLNSYTLEGPYCGISGVTFLTVNAMGLDLLKGDPILRGKITEEGLNSVEQSIDSGTSALYWLAKNPKGRRLLLEDARLRALISKEVLNAEVTRGEEMGKSAAYWLKHYGQELLAADPVLRAKIDPNNRFPLPLFFNHSRAEDKPDNFLLSHPENKRQRIL